MKILKLSPYCYPEEVSSSHLGRDLNEGYAKANIITENFVPTPSRGIDKDTRKRYKRIKYEEQFDGHLIIHRFSLFKEGKNPVLRALRYVICNLIQYYKGKRAKDIDLVYGASTPPTQGVLCALVAKKLSKKYKKKVPFIYNLQDVFPDSLVNAGFTKKGSLLWKFGRKIENYTYNRADKIIVISESIKQNILEKGVSPDKIVVIPNWINTDLVCPIDKQNNTLFDELGISRESFNVVYAGNMGEAQGVEVILRAAEIIQDKSIQFVLFGGGSRYSEIQQQAKNLPNVIVRPLLPVNRVSEVYSLGDVILITCKKGTGNAGMPSKTWSIMACNTPIIASFDTDSELASILNKANAGVCVEPGDAEALAESILAYVQDGCNHCEFNSRQFVERFASKNVCVSTYIDTIKQLVQDESFQ